MKEKKQKGASYAYVAGAMCAACGILTALMLGLRLVSMTGLFDRWFDMPLFLLFIMLGVMPFTVAVVWALGGLRRAGEGMEKIIRRSAEGLKDWQETAKPSTVYASIIVLSGLTLFLELVLIRWQGSLFAVFALYKNFTMLACFCGLGIGYAMSRRPPLLFPAALPLLAATIVFMTALRYAVPGAWHQLLFFVPVAEEASVFTGQASGGGPLVWLLFNAPIYLLLVVTFVLNVLAMIPPAQLCGSLMARVKPLPGYGCNLLGSIAGVVLLFVLSGLWAGPAVWFAVSAALLFWYALPGEGARRAGLVAVAMSILALAWPVDPLVQYIYSPYQLIQKKTKEDGLMMIFSAGSYFQKVFDFSAVSGPRPQGPLKAAVCYYELPFRTAQKPGRVAIVGAGTGNDVAAALRTGAAAVDAVEIDPVILQLGATHPEKPYASPRVRQVNDDARTFFRRTHDSYDTIVYGVLDSHILLSHGSNVRLDSFVYTQQGLQEAFAHLKPGGLMSVSFALPNLQMGDKIFRMLSALPGAGAPVAVKTGYDNNLTYTFMVSRGGGVRFPADFVKACGLPDNTKGFSARRAAAVDIPTDDWPFFYMEKKMYPASYIVSLALVMLLSWFFLKGFLPEQKWDKAMLPFFFLGGGFMLVETKAITELGLLFGNTWQVVGVTIVGVLVMAFFANVAVEKFGFRRTALPFALLLGIVALGYALALGGGLGGGDLAAKLLAVALLTSPMLFSGVIFSTLLESAKDVPSALAYNLMGAMLGGLLEYNSMQFGFASLYLLAVALYGMAWLTAKRAA